MTLFYRADHKSDESEGELGPCWSRMFQVNTPRSVPGVLRRNSRSRGGGGVRRAGNAAGI